jgi:hypothetical protein
MASSKALLLFFEALETDVPLEVQLKLKPKIDWVT